MQTSPSKLLLHLLPWRQMCPRNTTRSPGRNAEAARPPPVTIVLAGNCGKSAEVADPSQNRACAMTRVTLYCSAIWCRRRRRTRILCGRCRTQIRQNHGKAVPRELPLYFMPVWAVLVFYRILPCAWIDTHGSTRILGTVARGAGRGARARWRGGDAARRPSSQVDQSTNLPRTRKTNRPPPIPMRR